MNTVALDAGCLALIVATCVAFFRLLRNHESEHLSEARQSVPHIPRPVRRRK